MSQRRMRFRNKKRQTLICLGLFVLALLPRILALNTFITWDEPMWVYRSLRFLSAIESGRFADTFQVGAPGVTIMWAGALGAAGQLLLGQGAAEWNWLQQLATLDLYNVAALRRLALFLVAAKLPLVLLGAASAVGVYLLTRKLFGGRVALLAALLICFDPFHLAHSRVFHTDGAAANLMILSVLSLLVYLRHNRSLVYLGLSGCLAGLAFLTKATAFALLPFAALLLSFEGLTKSAILRRHASTVGEAASGQGSGQAWAKPIFSSLRSLSVWCMVAVIAFVALWPAMWVSPVETLRGTFGLAHRFAATPHPVNFFLGQSVSDPGPWFYPFSLLFRTTPLVWLGLLAAAFWAIVKKRGSKWFEVLALLVYVSLVTITLAVGAKKFERYLLPAFLALDILAAVGWVYFIEAFLSRHWRWGIELALSLVVLLQAALALPYHPYYLAYANPLLGGTSRAIQILPAGWGEGMDLAARYLNQKENATDLRVATWDIPGFAPLFKGQTEALTEHNTATADYAVLYVSDVQQDSPVTAALHGQQQPEHVVKIRGVDYAWIYPNTYYQELIAYLESQAQPDDVVLLDADSPFVKHYQGPLTYYVVSDSQGWTDMTDKLTESAAPRQLWYVAYPESDMGNWISYQLNTHALLIGREALPHTTVSRYLLTSPLDLDLSPIQVQANVNFGNRLRLTGHGFTGDIIEYRKQLGVALRWETQAQMQEGYALSLRLVDEQGRLWSQTDEWLENEDGLATYAWEVGGIVERHHTLSLLPGIPPGRYQVELVVYDVDTLQSLRILDERNAPAGTEYALGTVAVASPSVPPTIEELAIPHPLRHDFDGQVELLGYDLSSTEARAGETMRAALFWRALRSMESDYRLHLQMQDSTGNVWARGEFPLANEEYPTSRWKEGEVIRGQYDLAVDAAAPTGEQSLNFKIQPSNLQSPTSDFQPLATLSVIAPERLFTAPTDIQHPLRANLADKVAFLGYDLDKTTVKPGGTLHLTLYWQAPLRLQQEMETSYTVFTHLVDAQNRTWGQKDNLPMRGAHPTTSWLPGEVVVDEYEIIVDAAAPAGEYQIEVGMYDLETMQRLPAFDEQGEPLPGDRILLSKVQVQ